ncbi:hypothetical protein BESB_029370 [Besnoitia besnoiti]|uniref:Uncharacterized protein n=1 Tax=Besnoitia besnoiti TaxID=94643 RepID=A0A2A9M802_BESBE|nr:uncharacterized protein BESB_029370 [Besnoitia besnoiti]PFH31502.1 hypothetical protein BESB_029370 [Besnoitia besnoiti]
MRRFNSPISGFWLSAPEPSEDALLFVLLLAWTFVAVPSVPPPSSERPVAGYRGGLARPEALNLQVWGIGGRRRRPSLRQVADQTYFLVLLQEERRNLKREIGKLQAQMEVLNREAEQLPGMRSRKAELESQVEDLQEEIIVINAAMAHARGTRRPQDIARAAQELKKKKRGKAKHCLCLAIRLLPSRKPLQRALLDEFYLSNRSRAEQLSALQAELALLTEDSEAKLLASSPEARQTYEDLQLKLAQHQAETHQAHQEMDTLTEQLSVAEATVQSDPARAQLLQLLERRESLLKRQQETSQTWRACQGQAFAEQRAHILQEIERRRGEVAALAKRTEKAADLKSSQAEREAEIRKLRLLAEKDAEISAFIERYSEASRKRTAAQADANADLQEAEKTHRLLERQLRAIPTAAQAESLAQRVAETTAALSEVEQTLHEAKAQLEERKKELHREENLEQISREELRVSRQHLEAMKAEIHDKFDRKDDLRVAVEEERKHLIERGKRLRGELEAARTEVETANRETDEALRRLQESDIHHHLKELEAELERNRQTVAELQTTVDLQKKSDPSAAVAACMVLVGKINEAVTTQTRWCESHRC